jgi:SAM-dependent methyltransferase
MAKSEKGFWNKEYASGGHLALSTNPSGELVIFEKWFEREYGEGIFSYTNVIDIGCGNGRNLIHLAKTYGAQGVGFDNSDEGVRQAKKAGKDLKTISFVVHDIREPLPFPDATFDLALDLMVSHHLSRKEHEAYMKEVLRVLKPDGWLLWKTFLLDDDIHSRKLIADSHKKGEVAKDDAHGYIHPNFGHYEYVWSETELREYVDEHFQVRALRRSHGHKGDTGEERKRRYMVAYLERKN